MKRKFEENVIFGDDSDSFAKFYGFKVTTRGNFKVFLKEIQSKSEEVKVHVLICNLPFSITEEELILVLLKSKSFELLKLFTIKGKRFAFVGFSSENKTSLICDFFNNYESPQNIKAKKCRLINSIYISNLKTRRFNFYTLQFDLMRTLVSIKRITFYSIDKYKRYSLIIDFFEHCDTELGLELVSDLFRKNPEVIVDIKCGSGFRTEPAIIYEWKKCEDSQTTRPQMTMLNSREVENLQMG